MEAWPYLPSLHVVHSIERNVTAVASAAASGHGNYTTSASAASAAAAEVLLSVSVIASVGLSAVSSPGDVRPLGVALRLACNIIIEIQWH